MEADEYPGHERVVEAARVLPERLHWLLRDDTLKTKSLRAGHLLDHGVQVVEHPLEAATHEAPDEDMARGWIRRVEEYRES